MPKTPCAVCGDVAQGVNYNAVTCMSCKIFFRRNALRNKTLNCHFSDHCPITPITRRFCTKCRLARCFAVGMRKEPPRIDKRSTVKCDVQNVEEEEEVEIEKNGHTDEDDDFVSATFRSMTADEVRQLRTIKLDLIEYLAADGPPPSDSHSLIDLIEDDDAGQTPPEDYIRQCLLNTAFDDNDHDLNVDPLLEWTLLNNPTLPLEPTVHQPRHRLLPEELLALRELATACRVLRNPYRKLAHFPGPSTDDDTGGHHHHHQPPPPPIPEELHMVRFGFFRLLRMCAQLRAFTALPAQRQLAILQANVFLMVAVQLMAAYDRDRQCWTLIDDQRQVTVLAPLGVLLKRHHCTTVEAFHEHTEQHHRLIATLRHEWRADELLFGLLTVVNLFTPATFVAHMRESLPWDDPLRHQHRSYIRLLSRYLSVKYPQPEQANESFRTLMQCSAAIRNYWAKVSHLFGDKFRLIMQTQSTSPNTYSSG